MESPGCYRLVRNSDQWIATGPTFVSYAASPAGYGATYQEAIEDLMSKPPFQAWLRASGQSQPSLADFVIDDCPPENIARDESIAELVKGEVGNVVPLRNGQRANG
jgi:hypothetical protein